jgi:ubiquitin C-terminal hydrolase
MSRTIFWSLICVFAGGGGVALFTKHLYDLRNEKIRDSKREAGYLNTSVKTAPTSQKEEDPPSPITNTDEPQTSTEITIQPHITENENPFVSPKPRFALINYEGALQFQLVSKSIAGLLGFENLGNTCFMNASLQALIHSKAFHLWIQSANYDNPVVRALKGIIDQEEQMNSPVFSPQVFYDMFVHYCNPIFGDGGQHDSAEFLSALFDCLQRKDLDDDDAMNDVPDDTILPEIEWDDISTESGFSDDDEEEEDGYLNSLLKHETDLTTYCNICKLSNRPNVIEEDNMIKVEIEHMSSLDEALELKLNEETIDTYNCEHCQGTTAAKRQLVFSKIPDQLIISLKRFKTEGSFGTYQATKLANPILFEEQLTVPFQDGVQQYTLNSVICHSGTVSGGHYYSYAKVEGEWYKFNDSSVQRVVNFHPHHLRVAGYVLFYEKIQVPLLTY